MKRFISPVTTDIVMQLMQKPETKNGSSKPEVKKKWERSGCGQ
jgi:hypothetical protein